MLTKAWTRDFGRRLPNEKDFLEAAEARLDEVKALRYPEYSCRGSLIIGGKGRPMDYRTIPDGTIHQLLHKKVAEGKVEGDAAHYCRLLRGLRGLLMHEAAQHSYLDLLKGAKEIFPELEAHFPSETVSLESRTEAITTIFGVMAQGLKARAESGEQFREHFPKFCRMLIREDVLGDLRGAAEEWLAALNPNEA